MQAPICHRAATLFLAVLMVGLGGCMASGDRKHESASLVQAEQVGRMLAGSYAGRLTEHEPGASTTELVRLEARVARIAGRGVETSLSQRQGESEARDFILVFRPTAVANRLEGHFSPLDAQGRRVGSCPIEVTLRQDGFVARTNADTCRFGSGIDEVALVKEIAHDGQKLVIGDRVVDLQTGENRMVDRVLELERVRDFSGWAGVRESSSGEFSDAWRVAEAISIMSDGLGLDPADAGGMPLGVTLDLAPYRVSEGEATVLRLRVFDSNSGELLGQAWADPRATRIGLALPSVQVGLRLDASR